MDDVPDVVPVAQREERVPVGDVQGLDRDAAVEEGGHLGGAVRGDDDLLPAVGEGGGGVRPDHPQAAGDEDHRSTS